MIDVWEAGKPHKLNPETQIFFERKVKSCSGIYAIVNGKDGHKYIGQSKNLEKRRMTHWKDLIKNEHCNSHLQRAWNKYGGANFTFTVIEYVPIEKLNEREKYWINKNPSAYNIVADIEEQKKCYEIMRQLEPVFVRLGETYQHPAWHSWVYGGARNPILDVSRKPKKGV